jgi:ubiquinone/menaquinone biosynthesis C-methylase UbiE
MKRIIYDADYGNMQSSMHGYQGWINKQRFKLFLDIVKPKKKDKILEIGCSDGALLSVMSKFSDHCYGVDVNEAMIRKARKKGISRVEVMDAAKLNFPKGFFDKVYASHVIEHVPEIRKALKEVHRVLKPGGRFIILFPWEAFRGMRALKEAVSLSKHPLKHARQLHLHKLSPAKVRKLINGIPFKIVKLSIKFTLLPDYLVILEKK